MFRSFLGLVTVSISLMTLTGCDTPNRITGTITANSTIRIVTPGGNKHALQPGSYKAVVRMDKQGGQIFITAGAKEVSFKIPKGSSTESQIRVSAAVMKQEFGLNGNIFGSRANFDRNVEVSCVYDVERDYVCRDRNGQKECGWVSREIMGRQRVREMGYTQYKNIDIDLLNRASQRIGKFRGVYSYGDTVTSRDYLSGCYRW